MSLPAIPTIPGELTGLAQEFNEGESICHEALNVSRTFGCLLSVKDLQKLGSFYFYWNNARKVQVKNKLLVKLQESTNV